jgi:hypothetical protein
MEIHRNSAILRCYAMVAITKRHGGPINVQYNSKKGGGATIEALAMSLQVAANRMDAENGVLCDLAVLARLALQDWGHHVPNMEINLKRLTNDCVKAQAALAGSGHAHRNTGATAMIEPILPLIREFRAQKYSWAAIAAALAKQGVVQGSDRQSIAARRLTALISAINNRERRREDRFAGRARRRPWGMGGAAASNHEAATPNHAVRMAGVGQTARLCGR